MNHRTKVSVGLIDHNGLVRDWVRLCRLVPEDRPSIREMR